MEPFRGFCLAAVVLLSLVLPLASSVWRREACGRRASLRVVWAGQWLEALGGLWIVAAPVHPEWGVAASVIACLACLSVLRRPMRPARV
jgi:hypothetical protein